MVDALIVVLSCAAQAEEEGRNDHIIYLWKCRARSP